MLSLITTTINVPLNLEDYARDFKEHGHEVEIVVAGDRKTPGGVEDFCKTIGARYLSCQEQEDWLPKSYSHFLPWNSIQRRNVAILWAYKSGAEIIYTIDDDNYLYTKDYISGHGPIGKVKNLTTESHASGWYNPCQLLTEKDGKDFYPRGYSFANRLSKPDAVSVATTMGRIIVNAGLWIGDPDIDAVTRLAINPIVTEGRFSRNRVLGTGTKAPFNSQNTALHRDVIPAYCMITGVGRYDDIVPSYFVQRIADHLGDHISFGFPLVSQERNVHDITKDLADEVLGMQLIDRIVGWLYEIPLTGKSYLECIQEILPKFREKYITNGTLTAEQMKFMKSINANYEHWLEALK